MIQGREQKKAQKGQNTWEALKHVKTTSYCLKSFMEFLDLFV